MANKQIKDFTAKTTPEGTDQIVLQEAGNTTKKTTMADIKDNYLKLDSGTYTPTVSATTNLDSTTARECFYMRIGNIVTITGTITLDATSTGATTLKIDLPIVPDNNFTNKYELSGVSVDNIYYSGVMEADIAGTKLAKMDLFIATTASTDANFTLSYKLNN